MFLAADPYPWFRCQADYAVDVEIDPPVRQGRWGGFFRLVLAVPALLLATALGERLRERLVGPGLVDGVVERQRGRALVERLVVGGVAAAAAFLAWFAILARRTRAARAARPHGLRARLRRRRRAATCFLLTPRYPTSDPDARGAVLGAPASIPCGSSSTDDLERPRLTVLFRLFLAIPHFVWILAVVDRGALRRVRGLDRRARSTGRVPRRAPSLPRRVRPLRDAPRSRSSTSIGRRFPGFTGRAGSYGIDLEIDPRRAQNRWTMLFRLFLAIPAFSSRARSAASRFVIAFLGWWYALVDGADARGNAEPRRVVPALLGADVRVRAARHEPVPVRGADPARARARARGRSRPSSSDTGSSETRSEVHPRGARRRGAHASARSSSIRPPSRTTSRSATLDVDAVFGADLVDRREAVRARLLRPLGARAGRAPR